MADEEIKEAKSLRWLANQFPKVENPKDNGDRLCNCINLYCTNAAELIEKLHKENEIKNSKRANIFEIVDAFKRGKAEAYKEFAERLKENCFEALDSNEDLLTADLVCAVKEATIDNLLKELVGESDG